MAIPLAVSRVLGPMTLGGRTCAIAFLSPGTAHSSSTHRPAHRPPGVAVRPGVVPHPDEARGPSDAGRADREPGDFARQGAVVLVSIVAGLGCERDDGLGRRPISGEATLDGRPLAAGSIHFEPGSGPGRHGHGPAG